MLKRKLWQLCFAKEILHLSLNTEPPYKIQQKFPYIKKKKLYYKIEIMSVNFSQPTPIKNFNKQIEFLYM